MNQTRLRDLTEVSLFAALIFVTIKLLHFDVGSQFIHFGNALVVIAVLIFGSKKGAVAAALGVGIYDILSGYASVFWITILESLVVCGVIYLVYERGLKRNDTIENIIFVGFIAAVVKVLLNLFKYTLIGVLGGKVTLVASFGLAIAKIIGSYGTAVATVIAVPLLYPIFKQIIKISK